MTTIKEITIAESDLAAAMGRNDLTSYIEHVVGAGHEPGVLSGSSLKGEAKKYGSSYARARSKIIDAVRHLTGVSDGYALIDSRWARVWVDPDGNRVRLTVVAPE